VYRREAAMQAARGTDLKALLRGKRVIGVRVDGRPGAVPD
jgi:hypothetical protein